VPAVEPRNRAELRADVALLQCVRRVGEGMRDPLNHLADDAGRSVQKLAASFDDRHHAHFGCRVQPNAGAALPVKVAQRGVGGGGGEGVGGGGGGVGGGGGEKKLPPRRTMAVGRVRSSESQKRAPAPLKGPSGQANLDAHRCSAEGLRSSRRKLHTGRSLGERQ